MKNLLRLLCIILSIFLFMGLKKESTVNEKYIKHGIVFYEEGRFGGWPANHGIWIWGNEILVGFIEAEYKERPGLHTYDPITARSKYARSKDGGVSWIIEDAYERGQTAKGADHNIPEDKADIPVKLENNISDFYNQNFILAFQRHNNNNGPSHFYYSENKGHKWMGPYLFPNLGTAGVASRTDYIVDGQQELGVFLTIAKNNGKEGRVIYGKTYDGALNWEIKSFIGTEHGGFDIMPSSVRLSETELFTVIRTRTQDRLDLLTAYISTDNGQSWERIKDPVADTGRGGSPPALVKLKDNRLALGYAYRSEHGSRMNVRFSSDNGKSWSDEIILRCGDGATRDIGYPRMVQREDGKLVLIYYWNNANQENSSSSSSSSSFSTSSSTSSFSKPYRYIAYTIFDPDFWK